MTVNIGSEFEVVNCPCCFMRYHIPSHLYYEAKKEFEKFSLFCPAGHSWHFIGERDVDRMAREASVLRQQLAQKDDEIADNKRELARVNRRARAGICPCCKRSFIALARHIKDKHPEHSLSVVRQIRKTSN